MPKRLARDYEGIVTLVIFTCERGDPLIGREQENQWLGDFQDGAGPLQNPLFLTNVTMPVRNIQTARREQIFDVAIAERETHIQPNGVPDDRGRKLMAGKRDRHPPSYPTTYRSRDKAGQSHR
jgi:hypothetical protein